MKDKEFKDHKMACEGPEKDFKFKIDFDSYKNSIRSVFCFQKARVELEEDYEIVASSYLSPEFNPYKFVREVSEIMLLRSWKAWYHFWKEAKGVMK